MKVYRENMGIVINKFEFNGNIPDKNEVSELVSRLSGLKVIVDDFSESTYQIAFSIFKNETLIIENRSLLGGGYKKDKNKNYLSIKADLFCDETLLHAVHYAMVLLGGYNSNYIDISKFEKKFPISLSRLKLNRIFYKILFYMAVSLIFLISPLYILSAGIKKIFK